MTIYTTVITVYHDHEEFLPGTSIDLTPAEAESLLNAGAIKAPAPPKRRPPPPRSSARKRKSRANDG